MVHNNIMILSLPTAPVTFILLLTVQYNIIAREY